MDLKSILSAIQKTFDVKKIVDFDNIRIIMRPLDTDKEMNVVEACKDSGSNYAAQLKKSSIAYAITEFGLKNDQTGEYEYLNFVDDMVEYPDDKGVMVKETKYLFLLKYVTAWPVPLRDEIFDAFNEMLLELEDMISKKVKFERFSVQTVPEDVKREEPGVPAGFRKIEKPPEEEPITDAQKLSQGTDPDLGKSTIKRN